MRFVVVIPPTAQYLVFGIGSLAIDELKVPVAENYIGTTFMIPEIKPGGVIRYIVRDEPAGQMSDVSKSNHVARRFDNRFTNETTARISVEVS